MNKRRLEKTNNPYDNRNSIRFFIKNYVTKNQKKLCYFSAKKVTYFRLVI